MPTRGRDSFLMQVARSTSASGGRGPSQDIPVRFRVFKGSAFRVTLCWGARFPQRDIRLTPCNATAT